MTRKERTHLVAVAALLHDIGKVGQRAASERPDDQTVAAFCPTDSTTARPSHLHAAWTGSFIERYLPSLWSGRGGDNLLGWAARHHAPSTPLEWVVAEADRLSSGMDRPENEDHPTAGPATVALESLLARLGCDPVALPHNRFLPLSEFRLDRKTLFPMHAGTCDPRAYRALWEDLGGSAAAIGSLSSAADLGLVAYATLHLLERYTSNVPASTISTPRDVSLFDHARSAAALAACIAYDDRVEADERYVRDRADPRYALVCADISGIQAYLHALKSGGARRSLTGRSFFIQLLQDAVGAWLVSRFDLPPTCILYQGGGKVWLLLPSSILADVAALAEEVDLSLWNETGGLLRFAVGFATLRGTDFVEHNIGSRWADALDHLNETRLRRMASRPYDAVFGLGDFGLYDCEQCGRETRRESRQCPHCARIEEVGRQLGRVKVIHRLSGRASFPDTLTFQMPAPLDVTYVFEREQEPAPPAPSVVLSLDWPSKEDVVKDARQGRARIFWPLATSEPIEFTTLSAHNPGVPRLGVLRGDVDSLGDLFERGLPKQEQTFSRLAAFSRSLNVFFGAYVPSEVRRRWPDTVRIVFSGGDDCFLVGSFHAVPAVAKWLREEFQAYGGGNSALTLSAGVAIQDENAPLIATARRALEAERKAKGFQRGNKTKDAICLFDLPLSWTELERAGALAARLVEMVGRLSPRQANLGAFTWAALPTGSGILPRAFLGTLRWIASLYRWSSGHRSLRDAVNSHRWMWLAHYSFRRVAEMHRSPKEFLDVLLRQILQTGSMPNSDTRALIEYLGVVAEWAFLLTRPGG